MIFVDSLWSVGAEMKPERSSMSWHVDMNADAVTWQRGAGLYSRHISRIWWSTNVTGLKWISSENHVIEQGNPLSSYLYILLLKCQPLCGTLLGREVKATLVDVLTYKLVVFHDLWVVSNFWQICWFPSTLNSICWINTPTLFNILMQAFQNPKCNQSAWHLFTSIVRKEGCREKWYKVSPGGVCFGLL